MESRVSVSRTSPNDVKQRQMIVKLDDEPFATLMHGETMTRDIEPGHHRLKIDNTWVWKNVEFDVAAGEHATFRIINRAGRFTWWLVALLGAGPMYVTVERV